MIRFSILPFAFAAIVSAQPLYIQHVRVFDGNHVIENSNVVVDGGFIRAVGPNAAKPATARIIDGTGKTLLPGLIDSHTHTIETASLPQAPVFGVTTDLDMFTVPTSAATIKKEKSIGFPSLFSSGYLATAPGGHGTEYGIPVPTLTKPEEAQAWVDARIAEGSDYIKAVLDDSLEYGVPKPIPTLSKETLQALAVAAHKRGKLLVVHIGTLPQAIDAINAGADGLAHLFVGPTAGPDFGKLAAAHHIFVVPTLSVLNTICATRFDSELAADSHIAPYLLPASVSAMQRAFGMAAKISCEGANEAIRQSKAANVPILAGTDAGNPGTTQGASIHGEMELLVRAGLTPVEALHAATAAPAAAFHLDDRGQIAAGKRADLVLVNGNPTADIHATRDIAAVWVGGVEIDRAAWRAAVSKQSDDAVKQKTAPAPTGSESGLIADFENTATPASKFGSGFSLTTDQMAGGKSEARMEVTSGFLTISGEVKEGFGFPWSGVLFSPGATPMAPTNLSSKKEIQFSAKGESQTYELMVFTQKGGYQPSIQTFVAGPEWKQFSFPFAKFGTDASDVLAIAWTAGPKTGKFVFALDNIRLN